MFITSNKCREVTVPYGFNEITKVDSAEFVKLYINGVKAFQGLSSAGAKVFELIYVLIQGSPGTNEIALHYSVVEKQKFGMSVATFKRGMRELLEKQFIYESTTPNLYWLNIDYLLNGNRLAFIKEFLLIEKRRMIERIIQGESPP